MAADVVGEGEDVRGHGEGGGRCVGEKMKSVGDVRSQELL